jgi:hypothetical protein
MMGLRKFTEEEKTAVAAYNETLSASAVPLTYKYAHKRWAEYNKAFKAAKLPLIPRPSDKQLQQAQADKSYQQGKRMSTPGTGKRGRRKTSAIGESAVEQIFNTGALQRLISHEVDVKLESMREELREELRNELREELRNELVEVRKTRCGSNDSAISTLSIFPHQTQVEDDDIPSGKRRKARLGVSTLPVHCFLLFSHVFNSCRRPRPG